MYWNLEYQLRHKDFIITRYYDVEIKDLRDGASETTHLYGMTLGKEIENYTLANDPVWKGVKANLERLGFEVVSKPKRVERVQYEFGMEDCFWNLDYKEQQALEEAEANA